MCTSTINYPKKNIVLYEGIKNQIQEAPKTYWMHEKEYEIMKDFYKKNDPFIILHNQRFEDEVVKEIKNMINKEII